jgi:protein SCO1/2
MRKAAVTGLVLAGIGALVIVALLLFPWASNREPRFEAGGIGGAFTLASSKGGVVDSKDLLGKPYAVFFGFTHCPEVCPTTLYEITGVLDPLGDAAKNFRVLFITVDPERDSVETLRDYLRSFDPRIEGLAPTPEQLRELASDFRVFYAKIPASDGGYTMDHTATVFLFGADGQFAGTLAFGESAETRKEKVRKLLR